MKYIEKKKYRIIYDTDASAFEQKLNDAVESTADYNPAVTIDGNRQNGFLAYLTYSEDHRVPECVADELEVRGLQATCSDCPYLKRTTDNNRKKFPCRYARYKVSFLDSPACDQFYRELIRAFKEMKEEQSGIYEGYTIDDGTESMLPDVIDYSISQGRISALMLQKHFHISHTRATMLLDKMTEKGIVSERDGYRKRYVLISDDSSR